MNLYDFINQLRQVTGWPDLSSSFPDGKLQLYRNAVNTVMVEMAATCSPRLYGLTREGSLAIVAGTPTYVLDDWAARMLELRTADDSYAYQVQQRKSRTVDRMGTRGSTQGGGNAYEYELMAHTQTALYSSTYPDGSTYRNDLTTYGASATNATLIVSVTSSVTLVAAMVGHMLRLNGEALDYKIISIDNTAHQITVDRKIRGIMAGDGTTNTPSSYSSVSWEIRPSQRLQIRVMPNPAASATWTYRYMAHPRKLINDQDTPELQEEFHQVILKGALRLLGASSANANIYQIWSAEYENALAGLRHSEADETNDSSDGPQFGMLNDEDGPRSGLQPGTYIRGWGTTRRRGF